MTNKTSTVLYSKIQYVIDLIDESFFSGQGKKKLPELVFAVNTQIGDSVTAFVQSEALYDKDNKRKLQYLGINPKYLDREPQKILSTLTHELCHVYENEYIHIAKNGYHDKIWVNLMQDCGLEPVFLNKSKTAVNTKIKEGGVFEKFAQSFVEKNGKGYFNIVEYNREYATDILIQKLLAKDARADNADKETKHYNHNKTKYTCAYCDAHVWGKSGLFIVCGNCQHNFIEEGIKNEKD